MAAVNLAEPCPLPRLWLAAELDALSRVQAAALATGPVALVQPVLVLELAFTLVLAQVVFRSRLHILEWGAIVGLSAGLAALLYALRPGRGDPAGASATEWALGVGFALRGVLLAGIGAVYARSRIGGVFTWPQTYLLIVLGPGFFFTLQKSLQAGSLVASQPALTLSDPPVAVMFGVAVFGEHV
jgi:hypothetical protein